MPRLIPIRIGGKDGVARHAWHRQKVHKWTETMETVLCAADEWTTKLWEIGDCVTLAVPGKRFPCSCGEVEWDPLFSSL